MAARATTVLAAGRRGVLPLAWRPGYSVRSHSRYFHCQRTFHGKPFVVLDADAGVTLQLALNIAFRETVASQQPFIETLREFSRLANTIINICW